MEIIPLGDSALVVRVREQFEDAPDETLDEVRRVFQLLQRAAIPGVIELAPAYTSVAVFFDPDTILKTNRAARGAFESLGTLIHSAVAGVGDRGRAKRKTPRAIEILLHCRGWRITCPWKDQIPGPNLQSSEASPSLPYTDHPRHRFGRFEIPPNPCRWRSRGDLERGSVPA